jgi:hypothetical protein
MNIWGPIEIPSGHVHHKTHLNFSNENPSQKQENSSNENHHLTPLIFAASHVHHINKLPYTVLHNKSQHEVSYGTSPDLQYLQSLDV